MIAISNWQVFTSLSAMHKATGTYIDDDGMDLAQHYGE